MIISSTCATMGICCCDCGCCCPAAIAASSAAASVTAAAAASVHARFSRSFQNSTAMRETCAPRARTWIHAFFYKYFSTKYILLNMFKRTTSMNEYKVTSKIKAKNSGSGLLKCERGFLKREEAGLLKGAGASSLTLSMCSWLRKCRGRRACPPSPRTRHTSALCFSEEKNHRLLVMKTYDH